MPKLPKKPPSIPGLPRKPGGATPRPRGVSGAVAATLARRREARAVRVIVRDRTGRPRLLDSDEDPVAKDLLQAAEDLISAA
jgi:hypothetical protein